MLAPSGAGRLGPDQKETMITVRNTNPYFRGKAAGVQFKQATGGAIGLATPEQAEALAEMDGFIVEAAGAPKNATTDDDQGGSPSIASEASPEKDPPTLSDDSVTRVKGIGEAAREKLAAAGIITMNQLVAMPAGVVASTLGISEERADALQEAARAIINAE